MKEEFAVAVKAIIHHQGKFLIVLKGNQEDINPNTFDIPGGRIRFGEKLEDALKREVMEESGLEIKPLGIVDAWTFVKDGNFQLTGITYTCEALTSDVRLGLEHSSFEWINPKNEAVMKKYPRWLINSIKKALKIINGQNKD
ncbi:MAG: NUDIX domain-containing protein [bacterium]|nr:NUDIX domain-containing protein [bacterium]